YLTIREHLDGTLGRLDQAGLDQRVSRNLAGELLEIVETHDLRFFPERIGEAALGQPARDRHLTAFEMRLAAARTVMARARLAALVSLARGFASARARTAAKTLAIL